MAGGDPACEAVHVIRKVVHMTDDPRISTKTPDKTKNKTKRVSEAYLALLSKTLYKIEDAEGNADEKEVSTPRRSVRS